MTVGGLGLNDEPLICGGDDVNYKLNIHCYTYVDRTWVIHSNLTTDRVQSALSKLPNSKGLFITGGTTPGELTFFERVTLHNMSVLKKSAQCNIFCFLCNIIYHVMSHVMA